MALADSVPGISGGTIAFILGFYNRFINSLNGVFSNSITRRKESWGFLLKLSIGWVVGMIGSLIVISSIFELYIYQVSSLFIGLIVFSIPIIVIDEKKYIVNKIRNIPFMVVSFSVVVLLSYFSDNMIEVVNIFEGGVSIPVLLYIFAAGAIAITAMVLPGISGSTILIILGLYLPLLRIIKDILKFDFTYTYIVAVFILGIISGVIISVRIIKNLLESYRSQAIFSIIGLMLGSIYTLVQGPRALEIPREAISYETFSILLFIVGGGITFFLQWTRLYISKQSK
ncbi:MAG: DUF368 domain-containing protein [Clostridium sp.]